MFWEQLARIEKDLGFIEAKIDRLTALVVLVLKKEIEMAGELDTLEADVAAQTTVIGGVVTLLQKLNAELAAAIAANDPARIAAVSAKLTANTQALAAAVLANTPAANP